MPKIIPEFKKEIPPHMFLRAKQKARIDKSLAFVRKLITALEEERNRQQYRPRCNALDM